VNIFIDNIYKLRNKFYKLKNTITDNAMHNMIRNLLS